jgi:hypothetical protein
MIAPSLTPDASDTRCKTSELPTSRSARMSSP